jgi:predicted ATPase/DNA-binding SARP family transcriptional activator
MLSKDKNAVMGPEGASVARAFAREEQPVPDLGVPITHAPELLKISLFGELAIERQSQPVECLSTRKVEALLVYLACQRQEVSREVLATLFWENQSQEKALASLRVALTNLRKHLESYLTVSRGALGIHPDANVWLDVQAFDQHMRLGEYEQAIDLYRGDFLQGFYLRDSAQFEDWARQERERCRKLFESGLHKLVEDYLHKRLYPKAIGYARQLLQSNPLDETAHRNLMLLLVSDGQRNAALAQYEQCCKLLVTELGLEPEAVTTALYQQIRDGALATRKDMAPPFLTSSFLMPSFLTPLPVYCLQHNLPSQLTSFIGREKEIAALKDMLHSARLVTLTGPGGTGKTRLALQTAAGLVEQFADGVWLVELASASDSALVPTTAAHALGLREQSRSQTLALLQEYIEPKHMLLILDNCEHLIQGAAQFADFVLHAAPGVKILTTSREPLGMGGEMVYPVPSLETPEPLYLPSTQSLAQFEAVRLFTERACAVQPAFAVTESNAQAVAQICRRLDGIPLAIELAAARVKVLSAEQIAARLDDRFRLLTGGSRSALPRHQTLHALIDWSYGLLSESERVLFRRLSVFRSGWRLEAAEAVCQVGGRSEIDILDGLAGLVNKSLVDVQLRGREVQRYVMLETIRQYAQEKLVEADEAAQLRDRHTDYFVTFAEAMDKKLHSPTYLEALEWLDAEIDNHRLALNWVLGEAGTSRQNARTVDGLRLATALGIYWVIRSLHKEGYDWLSKGLALSGEEARLLPLRARAYLRAGNRVVVSVSTIQQFYKKSLEICRLCDDKLELAHVLIAYGTLLSDTLPVNPHPVDIAAGIELIKEGIAILEQFGDPTVLGEAFFAKAHIARAQKDYTTQRKMLEKSNACYEIAGNLFDGVICKLILADLTMQQGDYETARRLYEGVREFYRNINYKQLLAYSIGRLGELTYYQDDFTQADTYIQEAVRLFHNMGSLEGIVWSTRMLACLVLRGGQARRARQLFLESQSLGRKLPSGDQFGDPGGDLAFVLWMGSVADSLSQSVLAARFLGAVEKVLETFFKPQEFFDQIEYDRLTGKLRSTLDEQTFAAAWAEGRKLTLEQALEEALTFCRQDTVENSTGM